MIFDEIISHLSSLTSEGTVGGNVSQPVWRREIVCNEVGQHYFTNFTLKDVDDQFPKFAQVKCLMTLFTYVNFPNFPRKFPIQSSSHLRGQKLGPGLSW